MSIEKMKAQAFDLMRECEQLQAAIREKQGRINKLAQEIAQAESVAENVAVGENENSD